jgi:hypothetical protein
VSPLRHCRSKVKAGYWRSFERSEIIQQCYQPNVCEGGSSCGGGDLCDGYCAGNHTGPFCELCVDSYVKSADGSCTECTGSIVLAFVFPGLVVLIFLAIAVRAFRTGRLKVVADAAFQTGKGAKDVADAVEGAESSVVDALHGAATDHAVDHVSGVALEMMPDQAHMLTPQDGAHTLDPEDGTHTPGPKDAHTSDPLGRDGGLVVASDPGGTNPLFAGSQSPPPSPPSLVVVSKVSRLDSVSESISSVAAKAGCTKERVTSWQVKLRILISLVQVLSSLGFVFSIPYPPFYDSVVAYLSVFSLDLFQSMPLGCMIDLNHDHRLLLSHARPARPPLCFFRLPAASSLHCDALALKKASPQRQETTSCLQISCLRTILC